MAQKRVEMADAIGRGLRGYYSSWIVFFISAWTVCGLVFISAIGAPVGRWLGAPSYTEAYLIDVCIFVGFPIGAVLWTYLHRLEVRRRAERSAFLEQMGKAKLMTFVYDPLRIYRVLSINEASDSIHVVPVWNADGRVIDVSPSTSKRSAFRDFDPEAFLRGSA